MITKSQMRQAVPLKRVDIMRRKNVAVAMDPVEASAVVYVSCDGGRTFDGTPFQTATFGHRLNMSTFNQVKRWTEGQGA